MKHQTSADDQEFRWAFEACETVPEDFDHDAHVRPAYIYLFSPRARHPLVEPDIEPIPGQGNGHAG